jgi:hypothetical protein
VRDIPLNDDEALIVHPESIVARLRTNRVRTLRYPMATKARAISVRKSRGLRWLSGGERTRPILRATTGCRNVSAK